MALLGKGLRAKSMWALAMVCLIALIPAIAIGWQIMTGLQAHFSKAYVSNFTQLNRQSILVPLSRDLALARRFSGSVLMREWLNNEDDWQHKNRLFLESKGFIEDFSSHSFFVISAQSSNYYYQDANSDHHITPDYTLSRNNTDDSWFYNLLASGQEVNINVNRDTRLNTTRVWLNILIKAQGKVLGMAGTGIDLTHFIADFIATDELGVTPMIIDEQGAFQAHPDIAKIAIGSATGSDAKQRTIFAQLDTAQVPRLQALMASAKSRPEQVSVDWFTINGRRQLAAIGFMPELNWYVLTAIDPSSAQVVEVKWLVTSLLAFVSLLVILLLTLAYGVERLIIAPLQRLQHSATAIAEGDYQVSLPVSSEDEIGDLSTAFGVMASKVLAHTEELEHKVRSRTFELEKTNKKMHQAQVQINASIDYASLIQQAILPDQQLKQILGDQHFVLWQPRDVVGGDFYVFYPAEHGRFLVGVIDCAGHGVAGALMTMLARAALDHAINECGIASPAAILQLADKRLRAVLQDYELPRGLATNMDIGLTTVIPEQQQLVFAGAKMSLYHSDGEHVNEIKGDKRTLLDRRVAQFVDSYLVLQPERTYYLTSDGYLDQAGGEKGFGLGSRYFCELLKAHANLSLSEQGQAFKQALDDYQGEYPQRDDITLLAFKVDFST